MYGNVVDLRYMQIYIFSWKKNEIQYLSASEILCAKVAQTFNCYFFQLHLFK